MTKTFPKVFAALSTAAFLMATPIAAQDSPGGGGADYIRSLAYSSSG